MARTLAAIAVIGVAGLRMLSADSSSAQLTVGVTVVRSCAVEKTAPTLRLTCTAGANANLRRSESVEKPAAIVGSDDIHVITLNF
jgi:hypothetical protein